MKYVFLAASSAAALMYVLGAVALWPLWLAALAAALLVPLGWAALVGAIILLKMHRAQRAIDRIWPPDRPASRSQFEAKRY